MKIVVETLLQKYFPTNDEWKKTKAEYAEDPDRYERKVIRWIRDIRQSITRLDIGIAGEDVILGDGRGGFLLNREV